MSSTDNYNTNITFQFKEETRSKNFNHLLAGVQQQGIYRGGTLEVYSGDASRVEITPYMLWKDATDDYNVAVKLSTGLNVTVTPTPTNNLVIMKYTWIDDVIQNYPDYYVVPNGGQQARDIVFGKVNYSGTTIIGFDYADRTWGKKPTSDVINGASPMSIVSTTKVDNLNVDLLDDAHKSIDGTFVSNSDLLIPTEKAVKTYIDNIILLFEGQTLITLDTYKPISSAFPYLCMSLSDRNLSTANYSASFIAERRSRKVVYDELNTAVSSFTGSWTGSNYTLANNAGNIAMITELYEDWLFAGSPTSGWRILVSGGVEYNITGFTVASRIITVTGSPSGTSIEIYLNRIMGSTTSAKHFSWAGLGLYMTGQNKITGLRRRDKTQGHVHGAGSYIGGAGTNGAFGTQGDGNFRVDLRTSVAYDDGINGTPRTGSKTEIESATAMMYLYVGTYA